MSMDTTRRKSCLRPKEDCRPRSEAGRQGSVLPISLRRPWHKRQAALPLQSIQPHQTKTDCSYIFFLLVKSVTSYGPFLRQLLFECFDRLEQIAEFFYAVEGLTRMKFEKVGIFLFQTILHFVPGDRSGNSRFFFCSQ